MTQEGGFTEREARFRTFRDECLAKFEEYLHSLVPADTDTEPLASAMNYSLLSGGKRIRPLLTMATCAAFGVHPSRAFPAAGAVEMIHAYSLIHDDLPCMDDDALRRGRPTNHIVYGEAMALLAGDGLLTQAFEVLTRVSAEAEVKVLMIESLARAAGPAGMVGGQVADMAPGTFTDERLKFIHTHKTGRLIQAAIDLGALLGGATPEERSALLAFGAHLGHAFQMMDDWLDACGTTQEIGKEAGHDASGDKLTYVALYGADKTRELANAEYCSALDIVQATFDDPWMLEGVAEMLVKRRK